MQGLLTRFFISCGRRSALLLLLLLPMVGWGQATIPAIFQGPWASPTETGLTTSGLGSDYVDLSPSTTGGAAKFQTTSSQAVINFANTASGLSFYTKLNGSPTGSVLTIEESDAGLTYTTLTTQTAFSTAANGAITVAPTPKSTSRYIRFTLTTKVSGANIGLDYIQLAGLGTPPSVTTGTTTSTGTTTGTVGGNITALGTGAAITERGAYYSTTSGLVATSGGTKVSEGGTALGTFTTSITSLVSNTLYYAAAYASSADGTGRGAQASFTTRAVVSSAAATTVSYTTATAGGTITAGGAAAITDRGVYLSTTSGLVGAGGGTKLPAATLTGTGAYTVALSGLTPGTTYFVAAYGTNAGGTSYGMEQSFTTTVITTPAVTTAVPASLTSTGATLGGNVTSENGATATHGIVYSPTNTTPTLADMVVPIAGTGAGAFSQVVTLAPGTYYIRAYATNSAGTSYGVVQTLVVNPVPTITSLSPASINYGSGSQSITINGSSFASNATVTYNGVGKTVTSFSATQLVFTLPTGDANVAGTFAVVVTNPAAGGGTSNSVNFTVNPIAPTATTNAASSVSYTTATANGSVAVGSGNAAITGRGFYLSTTSGQVAMGGGIQQPNGTAASGIFSVSLTGLTPGLTYYVAAYGTNSVGTSYGLEQSFTTTPPNPVPTISSLSPNPVNAGAGATTLTINGTGYVGGGVTTATYNGMARTVTFVSATRLTIPLTAADVATAGSYPVVLTSSAPAGGTSNAFALNVVDATPTITSILPATATTSATIPTLTVTGTGFSGVSVITFAGAVLATTYVSATQLTAVNVVVPSTAGSYNVTVTNPAPGGTSAAATFTAVAPPIYTWNGTSTSWIAPGSWTPSRTTPSNNDRLIFDGSITPTVTLTANFTTGQTVAQLLFGNNVVATFNTSADRTLNISNGVTGADLSIEAGSNLTLNNPSTASSIGISLSLGTGATATVAGQLIFDGGAVTNVYGYHELLGSGAANSVVFVSGSTFRITSNASGAPFGTSTFYRNNLLFSNGSTLEQAGGTQPFGITPAPSSVIVLQPASTYIYSVPQTNSTPPLSDRTYGNLIFDTGTTTSSGANSPLTVVGNLTVKSGTAGLNLDATISIGGNLTVNSGASLTFIPQSGGVQTVAFNGTTAQTISGAGFLTFGSSSNLQINNAAGVTLSKSLALRRLQLASGLLTTDAANPLTLSSTAVITGSPSAASFVNGPLARATATGAATVLFPIGKGTAYRPLTLNIAAQTSATTYTGEVLNTSARTTGVDAPLTRVSNIRYATVTPNVQPTGFSGTITMAFGTDDYVTDPQNTTLVIAKRDGSANWFSIGRTSANGTATGSNVAGDLTSGIFTSFSDFALASTAAAVGNVLTSNPLPVELTVFSAQRQVDKSVSVKWATASERNSARFEVQRSFDGREFVTVATIAAQGNSDKTTIYATLDKAAPAGRLYYRLRQVDLNGTSAFSPVVLVVGAGEAAKVQLYPNPAHTALYFTTEIAQAYRVLNQLGQSLLQGITEAGAASIDIEALPTGLYFLELQTATGRTVQKFEKN